MVTEAHQTQSGIKNQINTFQLDADQKLIVIVNKIDLEDEIIIRAKLGGDDGFGPHPTLFLSAKNHIHMEELIRMLVSMVHTNPESQVIVSNVRHLEALTHAREAASRVLQGLQTGITTDFIAMDIHAMLHYLGEITGDITNDEILGNIFSKFCIGK